MGLFDRADGEREIFPFGVLCAALVEGCPPPAKPTKYGLTLSMSTGSIGDCRQKNTEDAAFSDFAFDCDCAAVGFDDGFANGQAEAGAAGGTGTRSVGTVESREEVRELIGSNSWAGVADGETGVAFLIGPQGDGAMGGCILNGVGEEVRDDLPKPRRISLAGRGLEIKFER